MPVPSRARAGPEGPGESGWLTGVTLLLCSLCLVYPFHAWKEYRNVNEQARLYSVRALVERGDLAIDHEIATYGDLQDKAARDGHRYCDKPVGLSVLAVPAYAGLVVAGHPFGVTWTMQRMRYALTLLCVTLPTILLLFLLLRYFEELGAPAWLASLAVVSYALGTIAFTYATQFIGHQLAAVLLFAHFYVSTRFEGAPRTRDLLLAGALAGFGAITDYFSGIAHLAIFAGYARSIPRRALVPLALGALATAWPLPLYNLLAFGSPARMSYGQEALPEFQRLHGTGFFGVTLPRGESLSGLLVSPAKGLFWLSPFLLLGVLGIGARLCGRRRMRVCIPMAAAVLIVAWLACSVVDWRAGWTIGPRHMVSILPFLATGVVLAVLRFPAAAGALAALAPLSVALVLASTLTLPAFDVDFVNPVASQALFLLRQGLPSPNLGATLGMGGTLSLALPALAAALALALPIASAIRARALQLVPACGALAAVAVCAFFLLASYRELPEPVVAYYQARVMKLVDEPARAAARFEQAVASATGSPLAAQVAARALPEAAALYRKLGDQDSERRLAETWTRLKQER